MSVLSAIKSWHRKDPKHPIGWLRGAAGSGKSAIARTVAEDLHKEGRLGGSFFFFRGAGGRSVITHFIPTLARQLTIYFPQTISYFEQLFRSDPFVTSQDLEHQFQKLLLDPIISSMEVTTPIIFVIDALDECDDKALMTKFIQIVARSAATIPHFPLKFMFTSRIEEHIEKEFETDITRSVTLFLSLRDFNASQDIRIFYQESFTYIYQQHSRRRMRGVPQPWPSESELDKLVALTQGLFIFARTVVNHVADGPGLPQDKLRQALHGETGLDNMYSSILNSAVQSDLLHATLGHIILLRKPLSIRALGALLQTQTPYILDVLLRIQSLLAIPENDVNPVRIIHTSLRDYLVSPHRSSRFYVDPPKRHFYMSLQSLMALSTTSNQIFFVSEIQKYASEYWLSHLAESLKQWDLFQDAEACRLLTLVLPDFAGTKFNIWVNTVFVSSTLQTMVHHLRTVVGMLDVSVCFRISV